MQFKSFLFSALALILFTGCSNAEVIKVVIYSNGGVQAVSDHKKLQTMGKAMSIFTKKIDDVLKIILTPSQIDEIINNEYGVEIQYSSKQNVYKLGNSYPIYFSKIYIPLSGKYSKFGVVYFFGDDEGYGSLPLYITTDGLNDLKKIIENIKIQPVRYK